MPSGDRQHRNDLTSIPGKGTIAPSALAQMLPVGEPFSWEHTATRLQCLAQDCEQLKSQLPHCTATLQHTHKTQDILKLTQAQGRSTNDRLQGSNCSRWISVPTAEGATPFPMTSHPYKAGFSVVAFFMKINTDRT